MKFRLPACLASLLTIIVAAATEAHEAPVRPYVDPGQLDVPWPKHSHHKQPWRGFLETKSGYDFLAGIGVNYHVPDNDALAVLPFQIKPGKFVVAIYVMTYDATQPIAEESYRLVIKGVSGSEGHLALYDPHEHRRISVKPSGRGEDFVEVVVPVAAHPRLLTLIE